ncbi:DUF4258 domain-containing protein [Rhodohalobacter halophilus]|uniref:DUF4258 domain-containing protein n=1 Tax=Rhodohalobacter halophilus TaxID=1812810 RepID=UPI00083FB5A6
MTQQEWILSSHAADRIRSRKITVDQVRLVIENPDRILSEDSCKHIYQKKIMADQSLFLYRVFMNVCKKPKLVITAYRTSKIEKYEH